MKRYKLVIVMLIGSVAINVVLAHRLSQFNSLLGTARVESLKSGVTVPPLHALDMEGQARTVNYDEVSQPTVLYILTPSCSWCMRNMDNFTQLVAQKKKEYRFIAVSLSKEDLAEYIRTNKLMIPVYLSPSSDIQRAYKLGGTPQTIVVSSEGRVLKNWEGAYVGEQKAQIEAFFHVTLPGVRPGS